jgi:hypothetical protein
VKYINEERFIVSSNTSEAQKNYSDNYDRIFGEKPEAAHAECCTPQLCATCGPDCGGRDNGFIGKSMVPDADAIECRLTSYANIGPAPVEASFPCEEPLPCTGCDEVYCECDEHDADCEKLRTRRAHCNCGRASRL